VTTVTEQHPWAAYTRTHEPTGIQVMLSKLGPETQQINNRRAKRYGAEVALKYWIFKVTRPSDRINMAVWPRTPTELGLEPPVGDGQVVKLSGVQWVRLPESDNQIQAYVLCVKYTFGVFVNKPKDIPDSAVAVLAQFEKRRIINTPRSGEAPAMEVVKCVGDAVFSTISTKLDEIEAEKRQREANNLVGSILREAVDRAKEDVKYEVRVAELLAGLATSTKLHLKKVIAELRADPTYDNEDGTKPKIDQRVLDAAIKAAPLALQSPTEPSAMLFRVSESGGPVKLEDVI
jgi:hypothetical protein